jgi:hypothetical protein
LTGSLSTVQIVAPDLQKQRRERNQQAVQSGPFASKTVAYPPPTLAQKEDVRNNDTNLFWKAEEEN